MCGFITHVAYRLYDSREWLRLSQEEMAGKADVNANGEVTINVPERAILFFKENNVRQLFILLMVAVLTACGGSTSDKPKADHKVAEVNQAEMKPVEPGTPSSLESDKRSADSNTNDANMIKALFKQMNEVDENLQTLQKEMRDISGKVVKAKNKSERHQLITQLKEKIDRVDTETGKLDAVNIPDIKNPEAKKQLSAAIALQKEWANNERAKYRLALEGDIVAFGKLQNELNLQAVEIANLYAKAASAVGLENFREK